MSGIPSRVTVMLSLQRALLGEVFPALRAVTVEWGPAFVRFIGYIDGEPSEEDLESLSCVSAEVAADFSAGVDVDFEAVRCDHPQRIADDLPRVYRRRESE